MLITSPLAVVTKTGIKVLAVAIGGRLALGRYRRWHVRAGALGAGNGTTIRTGAEIAAIVGLKGIAAVVADTVIGTSGLIADLKWHRGLAAGAEEKQEGREKKGFSHSRCIVPYLSFDEQCLFC